MTDWKNVIEDDNEHTYVVEDLVDWLAEQTWSKFAQSLVDWYMEHGYLTEKQEEAALKMRSNAGGVAQEIAALDPVTEVGMYRDPLGLVYKVQKAVTSSHLYAKRLSVYVDDDETGAEFVYEPGAIRKLNRGMKMTLEDAKAFGMHYGVCCVCSATLTDPKSIAAGIGPICARRV